MLVLRDARNAQSLISHSSWAVPCTNVRGSSLIYGWMIGDRNRSKSQHRSGKRASAPTPPVKYSRVGFASVSEARAEFTRHAGSVASGIFHNIALTGPSQLAGRYCDVSICVPGFLPL